MTSIKAWVVDLLSSGCHDGLDEDEQTVRRAFCGASLFFVVSGPIWGAIYALNGEVGPGLIPTTYAIITAGCFFILRRTKAWHWFRFSQLLSIFVLPFALMISLGGFIPGSAVAIWAIMAPIGALWDGRSREAGAWILAFLVGTIIVGLITPLLRDSNNLPDGVITTFFVLNLGFVCLVISALVTFYVRQMDAHLVVMRRNRELESAYMAQEVSLRQSDKLATIGRLSAGLAHELNNPAAAAQQASKQLESLLLSNQLRSVERSGLALAQEENDALDAFSARIRDAIDQPALTDPLDRSDRQAELQDHLDEIGVPEAWDVASSLVDLGVTVAEVDELRNTLPPDKLVDVLTLISVRFTRQHLIGGLKESTGRIIDLVGALKTYTYLDQASRQAIDVHEGIESTLVMLEHRLKGGIEVARFYGEAIPEIQANGSELNQVWTNLLDNAVDAMDGTGRIEVITMFDGEFVVVQIVDNGPGVPEDLLETIFDPFVTSKAPGDGTGLGLNIAHNIVAEKHGGTISVTSSEDGARFQVELPLNMEP